MEAQTRILKVCNDGIYINAKEYLPYDKTNLPKGGFTLLRPVYWKVEVKAEKNENGTLVNAKVLEYAPEDITSFDTQRLKGKIELLKFEGIDYEPFINQVVRFDSNKLDSLFIRKTEKKKFDAGLNNEIESMEGNWVYKMYKRNRDRKEGNAPFQRENKDESKVIFNTVPSKREYKGESRVNFNKATIIDRGLSFPIYIKELGREEDFVIANDLLKKEFNDIKEYIIKRLGRKTFLSRFILKEIDLEVVEKIAYSEDIDQIDESFFKTIKYHQIRELTKASNKEKGVHSLNDLLSRSKEIGGNFFDISISDVIQLATKEFTHRNSEPLRHLSQIHHHEETVFLTLQPHFGFVFYCFKNNNHFYIWELLDSHATYIWRFSNNQFNKAEAYNDIERTLSEIQMHGRNHYKTDFEKKMNSFLFKAIEHKFEGTKDTLDLDAWKRNLNSFLDQ